MLYPGRSPIMAANAWCPRKPLRSQPNFRPAQVMDSQPRIAPKYAFRFDPIEIKARYGSFDRAFAAGDYLTAVQL
ncbi:MAG TPA: hypothetical protein VKV32_05050, partial [Stellaceae bacterium]|nr:hypothetical protein [Stellaceae bacterium]